MLLEVLAIAVELGWRPAGQSVLEVCAGLAASRAEWEQAARFFGAAEAQTGKTGLHRDPADDAFLAPLIAQAREALGPAAFAAADAAGRALSYDAGDGRGAHVAGRTAESRTGSARATTICVEPTG